MLKIWRSCCICAGAGDGCTYLVETSPEIVAETDGPVDNPGGLAEEPDVGEHLREIGRVE